MFVNEFDVVGDPSDEINLSKGTTAKWTDSEKGFFKKRHLDFFTLCFENLKFFTFFFDSQEHTVTVSLLSRSAFVVLIIFFY